MQLCVTVHIRSARLLERTLCLHLYVCMRVLFYSVCVCESASALWVWGKKMSYGISDYVLQCFFFFAQYLAFFSPPDTESPGHCKSICRLKSDPELWSDLEPKQREQQCRETSFWVLCDLCGAWISPIVVHSQNSVSGWREKRSVKFMVQFTNVKLHTVCEVDFPCTAVPCVSLGAVVLRQVPVFLLYLAF